MNILLLGGTGAIGAPLVDMLSRSNNIYVTSRKERKTEISCVKYIFGNAHNLIFVKEILTKYQIDVIVDFMIYSLNEFKERINFYLNACKQYIFLSSSRVYAPTDELINENSDRLLDICNNKEYLLTDEYALTKARQENLLILSKKRNWTILRPYITYSSHRFQLGMYEKEQWLYRALNGRTVFFSDELAGSYTTLTFGNDVSKVISNVIANERCMGQIYQITCNESIKWRTVLNIYIDVIEKVTGKKVKVKMVKTSNRLGVSILNPYQYEFDRRYNRKFYSNKIEADLGINFTWTSPAEGLRKSLSGFLETDNKTFQKINWKSEAFLDKMAGERTSLTAFNGIQDKFKYLVGRYTPYLN